MSFDIGRNKSEEDLYRDDLKQVNLRSGRQSGYLNELPMARRRRRTPLVFSLAILPLIFVLFYVKDLFRYGFAPYTSKDPFPPYPDVSNKKFHGARIFGWTGCSKDQYDIITSAYDDTRTITSLDGYKSIDWNTRASTDFFGPDTGPYSLTQDVKDQIHQIINSTYDVFNGAPKSRSRVWIKVRCSSEAGDPEDTCRDRANDNLCPGGTVPTNKNSSLEAYVDNIFDKDWGQITFCNTFFNKNDLTTAMQFGSDQWDQGSRMNLHNYDNRARIFLHEVTRLGYLMHTPDKSPSIDELRISWRANWGNEIVDYAYGAYYSRLLGSYRSVEKPGYYAQRNADNYAFFALSRYVLNKTTDYPIFPRVAKKPTSNFKDGHFTRFVATYDSPFEIEDSGAVSVSIDTPGCSQNASSVNNKAVLDNFGTYNDFTTRQLVQERSWMANYWDFQVNGKDLRIMPLGDSITEGFQSSTGNGYRFRLYNDLIISNQVKFIGSVQSGTMAEDHNEGHGGAFIEQIAEYAKATYAERPNVVLLHAGTNDMNIHKNPGGGPERLGQLIDQIIQACPDAAIFVAQIIPSGVPEMDAKVNIYNAAIPEVIAQRVNAGHNVFLVDMHSRIKYPIHFADPYHPNDSGYDIIGNTWFRAIAYAASELGWITPPVPTSFLI